MNIVHINSFAIPLNRVSGPLQEAYAKAERDVASLPAGPQRNVAKAALNLATKNILIEQTPHLLLKASPRSYGAKGFFEALARRSA